MAQHVRLSKAPATGRGLQVVLYHDIADDPHPLTDGLNVATPVALFEAHLDYFEREYEVVDLDMLLASRLPKRPLLITFDDGYRSVLDVAAPLLRRRGLPAVLFASAAFLEQGSVPLDNLLCALAGEHGTATIERELTRSSPEAHSPAELIARTADLSYAKRRRLPDELSGRFGVDQRELRARSRLFLDHDELAAVVEHGIEIGNHTASHLFCRAIDSEHAADVELVQHKRKLESWAGKPVRSFSYPYGNRRDTTSLVEQTLADSGHEATFVVESRPNGRTRVRPWNRVGLDALPARRLGLELELLPRLRAMRDAVALR